MNKLSHCNRRLHILLCFQSFLLWQSTAQTQPARFGIIPSRRNSISAASLTSAICARGGTGTYGRVSENEFLLTPEQIETFHREGCVTVENVLTESEVAELQAVFDRFVSGEITVPGKDFCDMSKPFGIPFSEWSIVNCMLPTKYYPPLRGNIYEVLTNSIARQLFPGDNSTMVKDYDQLLNKRPGKDDAVFAWHQGRFFGTVYLLNFRITVFSHYITLPKL